MRQEARAACGAGSARGGVCGVAGWWCAPRRRAPEVHVRRVPPAAAHAEAVAADARRHPGVIDPFSNRMPGDGEMQALGYDSAGVQVRQSVRQISSVRR